MIYYHNPLLEVFIRASRDKEDRGSLLEGRDYFIKSQQVPAVWRWASHLTPIAYPYHYSALEPIHSIDSKIEGKG